MITPNYLAGAVLRDRGRIAKTIEILVGVAMQHPKPVVGRGERPLGGRAADHQKVAIGYRVIATISGNGGDSLGRQKV